MASAKQKAAARKNIKKAQAARRKSSRKTTRKAPKRKAAKRTKKTNKVRKSKPSVKRKGSHGRLLIDRVPVLKNKTVQKIGFALGMGRLASTGARAVPIPIVQQNARIIGTAVAFATDPLGGVVDLALGGGLGQLQNLFGGGNGGQNGSQGFA